MSTPEIKHNCIYCNRDFHFKDIFDQHIITCEFFYRGRRNRERDHDNIEILPTPQEQFKLVQHLVYQNKQLQKKVAKLENMIIMKKRKLILDWLKSSANPRPCIHFQEWIKTITVCFDDLEAVFEQDLIHGMKKCLTTYFAANANILPICAFKQKHGTIYYWTQHTNEDGNSEIQWSIMSFEDFNKWINQLSHRFLQEFILWKNIHNDKLRATEEGKEKLIEYMHKINGLGENYEQRRRGELKKWLFDKIAKDFTNMVDYEYC